MKLIQINTVCNGSTGKIMGDIQRKANSIGMDTLSFYGRRKGYNDLKCEKFGNSFSFWIHVIITTIFDKQGYGSYFCTKKLIKRLKEENPDLIHLHNLHGYYLNLPLLFNYLHNDYKGKIFWTFHDCWSFTGHCPHFIIKKCYKWKTECYNCPNKKLYPTSLIFDNSRKNYINKKRMFTGLDNLTIITPSDWLKNFAEKSFFKKNNIITINNGIDMKVFKKTYDDSIFEKYNIPKDKKIILGVANVWEERKGLHEFIDLSKRINNEYTIVLVGLKTKQIDKLSNNIIGIKRTENVQELVTLYSVADVFINPSIEESFSLVAIEALACETPIMIHKNTPMEEFITNETGIAYDNEIKIEDIEKIISIKNKDFKYTKKYDKNNMTQQIVDLYIKE